MKKCLILIIAVAMTVPGTVWAEDNNDWCPDWLHWFCGGGSGSSGGGAGGTWPPSGGSTSLCSEGEEFTEETERWENGSLLFCTWTLRCENGRWLPTGPESCS